MNTQFEEGELLSRLQRLRPERRGLFAASCATRLAQSLLNGSLELDSIDVLHVKELLSLVWRRCSGQAISAQEMQVWHTRITELLSAAANTSTSTAPLFEDTIAAIEFAIRAFDSVDPMNAVWAARRAYECVDSFVISNDRQNVAGLDFEWRVLGDPLIQQELKRQIRDLTELEQRHSTDLIALASELQGRAQREPILTASSGTTR